MGKSCSICGKAYKARPLGEKVVEFPACNCVYDLRKAENEAREQELRLIKAKWLMPNVRAFGGAACAGATFALATDAGVKAAESQIIPAPHTAIISYSNELKAREACVCISRKLIAEGYSTIPIDVHQVIAETDWSDLYGAEVVILHKLDDILLDSSESNRIFSFIDKRYRAERITWATTGKPKSELPSAWGKELSRILTEDCVFIQI
ncbi:MAG: hypothetical protein WA666_00370 [Nitrospirota bacterium]